MTISISMQDMLQAGVHFGHKTRYWNPKMRPYIFGVRKDLHIINLEHTLPMFRDALECIAKIASSRGRILFVGTKFAARDIIKEQAIRSGMPYVNHRWLGGMLTNYKTIRKSVKRYVELEGLFATADALANMTKKEALQLMREKDKLGASFEGIKNMGGLPDALFIIDVAEEQIAIQEANRLGIPVIAVVDTNSDPDGVDYLVPGNDDAQRAIRLYTGCVAETIIEARGVLKLADEKVAKKKPESKIVSKKAAVQKTIAKAEDDQADAAETKKPAATKAPVKKPVAKKSAVKKPAVKAVVAKKPVAEKVVAKKPAAKKVAAKKPAAKKKAD